MSDPGKTTLKLMNTPLSSEQQQQQLHGPTVSDHSAERGHRGSSRAYWRWRTDPKRHYEPNADVYRTEKMAAKKSTPWPAVFRNVTVYFNGRTGDLSAMHLGNLVKLCGGKVLPYLVRRQVTHVICTNLSASKTQQELKRIKTFKFVRPGKLLKMVRQLYGPNEVAEWITDCIAQCKRLSEWDYLVIRKVSAAPMSSFFTKRQRVNEKDDNRGMQFHTYLMFWYLQIMFSLQTERSLLARTPMKRRWRFICRPSYTVKVLQALIINYLGRHFILCSRRRRPNQIVRRWCRKGRGRRLYSHCGRSLGLLIILQMKQNCETYPKGNRWCHGRQNW